MESMSNSSDVGRGEFDVEILADLIAQGMSGQELLTKFKEIRKQIRPAVKRMLDESRKIAEDSAPYASIEDVFGKD